MTNDDGTTRHSGQPRHARTMGDFAQPLGYHPEPDDPNAEKVARELVSELLADAKSASEKGKRLSQEPEHPLIKACMDWTNAIQQRNPFTAEEAAQKVVTKMKMYQRRPAFKMLFDHLQLNHPLAAENLPWLKKLVDTIREGL